MLARFVVRFAALVPARFLPIRVEVVPAGPVIDLVDKARDRPLTHLRVYRRTRERRIISEIRVHSVRDTIPD